MKKIRIIKVFGITVFKEIIGHFPDIKIKDIPLKLTQDGEDEAYDDDMAARRRVAGEI